VQEALFERPAPRLGAEHRLRRRGRLGLGALGPPAPSEPPLEVVPAGDEAVDLACGAELDRDRQSATRLARHLARVVGGHHRAADLAALARGRELAELSDLILEHGPRIAALER